MGLSLPIALLSSATDGLTPVTAAWPEGMDPSGDWDMKDRNVHRAAPSSSAITVLHRFMHRVAVLTAQGCESWSHRYVPNGDVSLQLVRIRSRKEKF